MCSAVLGMLLAVIVWFGSSSWCYGDSAAAMGPGWDRSGQWSGVDHCSSLLVLTQTNTNTTTDARHCKVSPRDEQKVITITNTGNDIKSTAIQASLGLVLVFGPGRSI